MIRNAWIVLILVSIALALPGCGGCMKKADESTNQAPTGFSNPEDLARVYLKAVQDKDMDSLKSVLIAGDDLRKINRKFTDQHWEGYFTHNKRLFLDKNKDLLGMQLNFLSFRPGTEIKLNPEISIFRGAQILAELPDSKRVALELNFMVRSKGMWKIAALRYLHPKANVGQGPKVTLDENQDGQKPKMDIPGPKPKMEIKVTKINKDDDQEQAPPDDAESLKELQKLFE